MKRTLFAALFVLAAPLLAAANEVLVGGTAFTRAPKWREGPATASNGDHFFSVWTDARSGSTAIVGTRVTRDGRVLDPLGIRLSPPEHFGSGPRTVWDGGAYLVVWSGTPWSEWPHGQPALYAARIDAEGRMVMAPRVIAERGTALDVASNGNASVVVYQLLAREAIRTVVLDGDGNPVAHEILPVIPQYRSGFTIAAIPSGFAAAWSANPGSFPRDDTIQAVALDANGRVAGGAINIGNGVDPSIATDGTRVMFAWRRYTFEHSTFLLHTRALDADLSNAGTVQTVNLGSADTPPILLRREGHYEIVAGFGVYPTSHTSFLEVRAIELLADGRATGSRTLSAFPTNAPGGLAAATNGAELLLTMAPRPYGADTAHVQAQVVRGSIVEPPVLLSWSGNAHHNPSLASSPSGFMAAWTEEEGVHAARLDANGNSLDKRGLRFSTRPGRVLAAFNGTHYVVAWHHEDRIGVRWISPSSGRTVSATQVRLVEQDLDPAFARVGFALAASPQATYVVSAQDRVRVWRIPHTTYRPDAAPLDVSPANMKAEHLAAAWNGSMLLVAWTERSVAHGDPPIPIFPRIHAARVSAGLTLLDPAPLLVADGDDPDNPWSFSAPSVASNGADWLIVADRSSHDVVGRRVLQNGTLEGSGPVTLAQGETPAVAWNGEQYVLAWKHRDEDERLHRLYAAAVPSAGELVATSQTLITRGAAPSLLSLTGNTVAYTKYSFLFEHTGVERTFLSNIELDGQHGRMARR